MIRVRSFVKLCSGCGAQPELELVKNHILKFLTREPIVPLFRPFQHGATTIFMLHRFADAAYGNRGHSIEALRANLSFLRRHKFRLIGLPELLRDIDEGRLGSAVLFTVDDGYADFARVAAPVFAEFDCPVTVFTTTGFIDGGLWMWWDKIIWACTRSKKSSVQLQIGGNAFCYTLDSSGTRLAAAADLTERLKRYEDGVMQRAIDDLLRAADVELPPDLPDMFLPLTWNDISRLGKEGVTFGPHTVSHPILSQVDDARSCTELEGSWQRLRTATSSAIPVFCFPNGDYASFTDRERRTVKAMGMRACVLAEQHFTTLAHARSAALEFTTELPRFAYPDDLAQFRQIVSGMERMKNSLRNILPSSPSPAEATDAFHQSVLPVASGR